MTSRRSSKKGHRKHSNGGFSDTSSGGSLLDETDREVSNLTDRAFRSLCIGDEAIYNDSDLGTSSPQRDRQLAFSNNGAERDRQREEVKRATHESFSLRMQQCVPDRIHGERYVGESNSVPLWDVYGERTQGRASAQPFVEMWQPARSLDVDQELFSSNRTNDLRCQQPRSRSRVSSLIKAFNSDGQRETLDGRYREGSDDSSWNRSSLMNMQSEFSTSYQQNYGPFPPAAQFSLLDNSYLRATTPNMNAALAFTRSPHSKHSTFTHVNCSSNFFIHSEFSPFQVWRDYNRTSYQQQEFSGFIKTSDFPQWCESKMYKGLSMEAQIMRNKHHQRNNMQSTPSLPRTPVTSNVLQKASALEKRCESELAGNYPHWKSTKRLGTNRIPSQRPSTASPTTEMSRRVQDTISSVKALQEKIRLMAGQNIAEEMTGNPQNYTFNNQDCIPHGYNGVTPNFVTQNTSTTPYNISQMLTPNVSIQQVQNTNIQQHANSLPPVEHAPVRAESRGGTPDIRMSSYKSKGASLLFNLKDNRKRVKSTYSPPKFKSFDSVEKNKQPPRDTVIDIPEFLEPEIHNHYESQSSMLHSGNYHLPPATHSSQSLENPSSVNNTTQSEVFPPSGYTGFKSENYTRNQAANHQNPGYDPSLFTPYQQSEGEEAVGAHFYRSNPCQEATQLNDNHMSAYPMRQEESQHCLNDKALENKSIGRHHNDKTDEECKLRFMSSPGQVKKDQVCLGKNDSVKHFKEIKKSTDSELSKKPVCDHTAAQEQETGSRKPLSPLMKMDSVQPTTGQINNNIEDTSLSITAADKKVTKSLQGESLDVTAGPLKQDAQANLAACQLQTKVDRPTEESAELILAAEAESQVDEVQFAEKDLTQAKAEFKMVDIKSGQSEAEETRGRKQIESLPSEEQHTERCQTREVEEAHRGDTGPVKEEAFKQQVANEESSQIQPKLLPKENPLKVLDQGIKYILETILTSEHTKVQAEKEQTEGEKRNIGTAGKEVASIEQTEESKQVLKRVQQDEKVEGKTITVEVENKKTEEKINAEDPGHCLSQKVRTNHSNLEKRNTDVSMGNQNRVEPSVTSEEEVKSDTNNVKVVKTETKERLREKVKKNNAKKKEASLESTRGQNSEKKVEQTHQHMQLKRHDRGQVNRGAEDYDSLREKYGFIYPVSTQRNKVPSAGNSSTVDENIPLISSATADKKTSKQKPKDQKHLLMKSSKTENKITTNEDTESLYVYSESSKEFRIGEHCSSNSHEQTTDNNSVADEVKKATIGREEKSQKQIYVSSDSERLKLPEGKSTEHVVLHKSHQSAKVSTHRERALTKQEILTSKIKAHAEKEISAIKEKGFAKNPSKHFPGSHYHNVKQMLSKEPLERQESKLTEVNGDPLKEQKLSSSKAASINTTAKSVPEDSFKTNRPGIQREEKETTQDNTEKCIIETQCKQMDSEAILLKNKLELERKEKIRDSKEGCTDETVKTTEKSLNNNTKLHDKHEGSEENSFLTLGPKTPQEDDLQIMGIMVTVRENTDMSPNSQKLFSAEETRPAECPLPGSNKNSRLQNCTSVTSENDQKSLSSQAMMNNSDRVVKGFPPHQSCLFESLDTSAKVNQTTEKNIDLNSKRKEICSEECEKQIEISNQVLVKEVKPAKEGKKEDRDNKGSHASVKENVTLTINQPKCSEVEDKTAHLQDEKHRMALKIHPNYSGENTPRAQNKMTEVENKGEDDVHIDNIAIKIVSSVVENDVTNPTSNQLLVRSDEQTLAVSDSEKKIPDKEVKFKDESEDDNGVERVLSSIRKLADCLKQTQQDNQHSRNNRAHNEAQARPEEHEVQNNVETTIMEQDYFHIEGRRVANAVQSDNTTIGMSNNTSQEKEVPIDEMKSIVKRTYSKNRTKSQKRGEDSDEPLKQTETDASQGTLVRRRNSDSRSTSRERQRNSGRIVQQKIEHSAKEEPEIQSKPKRAAAIPEISAIADYARLKVIVSEKLDDTFPDVPPNKKEGFFPLIQSRRSRCPNFTDQEDHYMKEKGLTTKTDLSPKINKEPKPVVFPITEKAHQRTGMFKLGEKERAELDLKNKAGALENVVKQDLEKNVAQGGDLLKADIQQEKTTVLQTFSPQDKPGNNSTPQQRGVSKPEVSSVNRELDLECFPKGGKDSDPKIKEHNSMMGPDNSDEFQVKTSEEIQKVTENNDICKKELSQDLRITKLMKESKAFLEEEQERAARREQERRAREREAITAAKKERRQKQKEEEKLAEEGLKQGATKRIQEERGMTRVYEGQDVGERLDVKEREMTHGPEEESRETKVVEQHQAKASHNKTQKAEKTTVVDTPQNPQDKEQMRTRQCIKDSPKDEENRFVSEEKSIETQRKQTTDEKSVVDDETRRDEMSMTNTSDFKAIASKEEATSRGVPQKPEAQLADALQYYAITTAEPQRRPKGRQTLSPTPFQHWRQPPEPNNPYTVSQSEDFSRSHRPQAPPSPVSSLPRSNTTSPALGAKPLMFRVKDNTNRSSSLTKSVKPRFHKNFGEDFRVGSPMELIDEEQQRRRYNTDTPTSTSSGLNAIYESTSQSSSQVYSAPLRQNRPYSRRSIAIDEDDSRSVFSNMSEDVESFATGATDVADIRGLYDYDRPESACSFSSDMSRTMGKPPLVPPKSEKALRRAQRLTTRRIKKEISKVATTTSASIVTPPSTTEVCSSNSHAVTSPHCSAPVSLTHAPTVGSSLPSFPSDQQSATFNSPLLTNYSSIKHPSATDPPIVTSTHASGPDPLPHTLPHATNAAPTQVSSPHATDAVVLPVSSHHKIAPFSLPMTSPHVNVPVSLPVTSPHTNAPLCSPLHGATPVSLLIPSPYAKTPVHLPVDAPNMSTHIPIPHSSVDSGFIPQPSTPKIVSHVPSSPTLHHPNYPVTQYHVESGYAPSYPLTQRRVMQDIGSGQYFIVDAPVQVKMKTFFDPETGKYVQLNVRESGQGIAQHQPQPMYPQPPLQTMMQVNPQLSVNAPATKGYVQYEGHKSFQREYQPTGVPKRSTSGMSVPLTDPHDTCDYQSLEHREQYGSPEHTPYMDTVNEKPKTINTVYNQQSSNESTDGGHLSDPMTNLRCQPRDIITMCELEDFMEISDF